MEKTSDKLRAGLAERGITRDTMISRIVIDQCVSESVATQAVDQFLGGGSCPAILGWAICCLAWDLADPPKTPEEAATRSWFAKLED